MQRILRIIFVIALIITGTKLYYSKPWASPFVLTGIAMEEREGSLSGSIILNNILKINGVLVRYIDGKAIVELPGSCSKDSSRSLVFVRQSAWEEILQHILDKDIEDYNGERIDFSVRNLAIPKNGKGASVSCKVVFNDFLEIICYVKDELESGRVLWPGMKGSNGWVDIVDIQDKGLREDIEEEICKKCRLVL